MADYDPNTTPAGMPPPGVTPNLVDPPTMWHAILATIVLALTFTITLVGIRLFTKIRILRKVSYEDYILVLAQISLVVWSVLLIVQPTHGASLWNTSITNYVKFAYWSNLLIILYVPGILLAKWAILLQLQRVFAVLERDFTWWAVRCLIWISTIFYVTVGFIDVFQCNPREKIWNPKVPGHCFNVNGILIGTSVFNVLMNCSILALPLFVLHGVQMQKKKKIIVCAMFGVTAFAAVSSIMRTVYSGLFVHTTNPTKDLVPVALWALAEIACIIVATTFPTMPRFYDYVRSGFNPNAGRQTSPETSKKQTPQNSKGQKSWYQLTTVGDEEKANESETEMAAATDPESKQSRQPSRGHETDSLASSKAVEVDIANVV